jgi:hypothetical protein
MLPLLQVYRIFPRNLSLGGGACFLFIFPILLLTYFSLLFVYFFRLTIGTFVCLLAKQHLIFVIVIVIINLDLII